VRGLDVHDDAVAELQVVVAHKRDSKPIEPVFDLALHRYRRAVGLQLTQALLDKASNRIALLLKPRIARHRSQQSKLLLSLLDAVGKGRGRILQAMDNATSNCKEMITSLTLVFNKARQAAITAELMDIVGGAEALKG